MAPSRELLWAAEYILAYKEHIQEFIDSSAHFNNVLFAESYDNALNLLDSIEERLGCSLWSIEKRFFLLQARYGLEQQKEYLASIRKSTRNNVVGFLAFFFSQRNEEVTTAESFRKRLGESLDPASAHTRIRA